MSEINISKIRDKLGISQEELARKLGVSSRTIQNWEAGKVIPQSKHELLREIENEVIHSSTSKYNVSDKKGVPYFDVDFIGGFGLVENDQTKDPTYYIEFAAYDRAEYWVNITGRSMEPMINHGDIIALRKIDDWKTYILYGEIYAIVTDEYRTVKKVRKSSKGDDFVSLVPVNPEYDVQDIPKSIIKGVFQVLGCAKKIF